MARILDYYDKGLDMDTRIYQLFEYLTREISPTFCRYFTEKSTGHKSFRSMGMNDEQIRIMEQKYAEKFCHVNSIMISHDRMPLFPDPDDTARSSAEYLELMKIRSREELIEIFGCTYDEYQPLPYDGRGEQK